MADTKTSLLTALTGATIATNDILPIVDTSAVETKGITVTELLTGVLGSTSITGATLTANAPVVDFAQTWNNAAVTFTSLKLNVTDTASNAASLLMDLGTGGVSFVSKFKVSKGGNVSIDPTSVTASCTFSVGGRDAWQFYGGTGYGNQPLNILAPAGLTFTTSSQAINLFDTILTRRGTANLRLGAADTGTTSATVTITIAVPGVVTWASHGLTTGSPVSFTTTGALPTGIVSGTIYYAVVITTSTIQLASSFANAVAATPTVITTTGTQSGVHTGARNAITQALSVQSVTGVADRPGADMLITGSQGTGNAAGGSLIFQVAPAASSGSAQNALATALIIEPAGATSVRFGTAFKNVDFTGRTANDGGFALYGGGAYNTGAGILVDGQSNTSGGATTFIRPGFYYSAQFDSAGNFTEVGDKFIGWSSTTGNSASLAAADVRLYRDDANKLALRNGTTAQTFRVYNTFTDASNYERGGMQWSGGAFQVGVLGTAGTGSPTRSIQFLVNNGAHVWNFSTAGHFLSAADNAYDIGAVSATRPRSVYVGTSITPGAGVVVASLPTPTTGMIARVTDASAPVIGTTVAGSGAAYALVNYNGANWTVIGV